MEARRAIQTMHRWLGLILAAQVLLWMTSGVVMSWFPIGKVRGETAAAIEAPLSLAATSYFPPGGVAAAFPGATEIRLKTWLGRTVYSVKGEAGAALFDAETGERLTPLPEALAKKVAAADFRGEGDLKRLVLMNNPPAEYRGPTPVWRADFTDADKTRLYISPQTGEVAARRNRVWRLYDFFWMLHIMDYDERENFNNPLIRAFALTGFLFALSGVFLVVTRIAGGRYKADIVRPKPAPRPSGGG
ncbi:MAG TPA: PepSY domain-containing protein [Parvularcula sp.]|nr:PepSY domain-containing protein [Parvularcula sp.]HBS31824.1 PepSY domain-containing protein [Parvularcula sp.]HBS34896.1 PepSY domain-containing protein [Parvularcula sp.]